MIHLTPREIECIEWILTGKHSKEVAIAMGARKRTVDFHLANIYRKLGITNRVELVLAYQQLKAAK